MFYVPTGAGVFLYECVAHPCTNSYLLLHLVDFGLREILEVSMALLRGGKTRAKDRALHDRCPL